MFFFHWFLMRFKYNHRTYAIQDIISVLSLFINLLCFFFLFTKVWAILLSVGPWNRHTHTHVHTHTIAIGYNVLYISIRCFWLSVLFNPSVFFLLNIAINYNYYGTSLHPWLWVCLFLLSAASVFPSFILRLYCLVSIYLGYIDIDVMYNVMSLFICSIFLCSEIYLVLT